MYYVTPESVVSEMLKFLKVYANNFFDQNGNTNNGQKFFFPEHPEIDSKTVVGIEAHLRTLLPGGDRGDLDNFQFQNNLTVNFGQYVYLCFYIENYEDVFYNVPLISLFGQTTLVGSPKQKIKPYFGKIKTRNCYAYIPANSAVFVGNDFYIHITTTIIFSATLIRMNEVNLRNSFNLLSTSKIQEKKWQSVLTMLTDGVLIM